jgi:fructose 1,6-bisphosphatase
MADAFLLTRKTVLPLTTCGEQNLRAKQERSGIRSDTVIAKTPRQLADGKLIGPRDMSDYPLWHEARREANIITDLLRQHGPFEPDRLLLEEMEYTALPQIQKKLEGRWEKL